MRRIAWSITLMLRSLACYEGALARLRECLDERIKRLGELAAKLPRSVELAQRSGSGTALWIAEQEKLARQWPALAAALKQPPADELGAVERSNVVGALLQKVDGSFVEAVRALPAGARRDATAWLQQIVERTVALGNN